MKVKEDVDVLMSQCETYLKEKEEAVQATKNLWRVAGWIRRADQALS